TECSANEISKIRLLEDYMTAEITFKEKFNKNNSLTLCNIKDIIGGSFHTDITFMCYDNFVVTDYLTGKGAFSVKATLSSEDQCVLMSQGEEISLSVGDDRYVYFKVGNVTLKSASSVRDKVQVMAVREKTGALKIYLDGVLDSGIYAGLYDIRQAQVYRYNEGKVVFYNKAFAYDEV
ncbi:MAG: hypothetical protein J6V06_09395, partial [Clostridia bacterium]|nr:hypothetical protein [Clostridia bacterium]